MTLEVPEEPDDRKRHFFIEVAGRLLRPRGDWDSAVKYDKNDVVQSSGSSYYALFANRNDVPPSDNWALLAAAGANGSNGSNGSNGLTAYQVAVNNGFSGTEAEWLESLQGEDGEDGTSIPEYPGVTRELHLMHADGTTEVVLTFTNGILTNAPP